MKKNLIPTLLSVALSGQAFAATDAELLAEIKAMQARLVQLETKVTTLQQENTELRTTQNLQAEKVAEAEKARLEASGASNTVAKVADSIELSGVVEVGAYAGEGYTGDDYSDLTVDTASVGITAQLNDYSSAEISLLYEEDATDLEVDTASITFAKEGNPFSLQLGQTYLPFGAFSTSLVNDPLTLELAETRETAAIAGLSENGFTAQTYVFNGDVDHDSASNNTLQNWGARLAYDSEPENAGMGVGMDYISNIADSDGIQGFVEDSVPDANLWLRDERGAWAAHGYVNWGPVNVTAEYVLSEDFSAIERFTAPGMGESPEAWQLEAAYTTQLFDREYIFAMAWQESEDALFLELPERRQSVGVSTALDEKTTLGLEIWRDKDYGVKEGGTGDRSNNIGVLLTREF